MGVSGRVMWASQHSGLTGLLHFVHHTDIHSVILNANLLKQKSAYIFIKRVHQT